MRPELKPGVYWLPDEAGAHVLHNGGHLSLAGQSAALVIERLVAHLTGRSTVDELLDGLPVRKQAMVRSLIAELTDAGCIRDASHHDPHTLSEHDLRRYAAEIGHIGHFADAAAQRFQRYRESTVLLCGAGRTLAALVQATLRSGLRRVSVLVTPDAATDLEAVRRFASLAPAGEPGEGLAVRLLDDVGDAGLAAAVATADAVLHVSDRPVAARFRQVDRLCVGGRGVLIQALVRHGRAWIGPAGGRTGRRWESAWRRMNAARPTAGGADPFEDPHEPAAIPSLSMTAAAVVAGQLHAACFRVLTGITTAADADRLTEIDLETLQTERRRVLEHPAVATVRAVDAAAFARGMKAMRDGAPVQRAVFTRRATACFDPAAGALLSLGEHDYTQLPLRISRVTVSTPVGLVDTSGGHPIAVAAGGHHAQARLRATMSGLAMYSSLMVDHRRALPGNRMWAYDPLHESTTTVDMVTAFPVLADVGSRYQRPTGLAAALSWPRAVEQALLDHCRALAMAAVVRAAAPFPRVPLASAALTGPAARYRRMLQIIGMDIEVYDVGGAWGLPVYGGCTGSTTIAYCAAATHAGALTALLEQVLLWHQARTNGQPDYAPPAVPSLPPTLRGRTMPPSRHRTGGGSPGWRMVAKALTRHGHRPLLVPLDHDPVVADVLPYTVQAVLGG